jgi:hypothetical protein
MSLLVRDLDDEVGQLAIALLDAVDVAPGEEALAQEADLSLHTALLVSAIGTAQPGEQR